MRPLAIFEAVLKDAQNYETVCEKLRRVKRTDEVEEVALNRVIEDYREITRLIYELGTEDQILRVDRRVIGTVPAVLREVLEAEKLKSSVKEPTAPVPDLEAQLDRSDSRIAAKEVSPKEGVFKDDTQAKTTVAAQIQILRELPNGWKDGEGKAFSSEDLSRLEALLDRMQKNRSPFVPFIYPTVEGNVVLEWSTITEDVCITYHSAVGTLSGYSLDIDPNGTSTFGIPVELETTDPTTPKGEDVLARYLARSNIVLAAPNATLNE